VTVTENAYAKVNLVLRVGPPRADGLHPLCSLFASLALADTVQVEASDADVVVCPGVAGENLAARAAAAFRAVVPKLPPLRMTIDKRIPVAGGLGGGSADAAAVLRAANRLTGAALDATELRRLAAQLGSDVPSQVEPRHALVSGVGERVAPAELPAMALVLVPQREGLSTAAVYAELDRLRGRFGRPMDGAPDPEPLRRLAAQPLRALAGALENDLQPAAMSLRPQLARPLASLVRAGALAAQVTGSGPTTFGVFADRAAATAAAAQIEEAIVTEARTC
jgi:4-diphosphocytidyl-2-C-methyl-D-erythritol kinase